MFEHYAMDAMNSQNMRAVIPLLLAERIQPKFDPFGLQIAEINNPHYAVDSRIGLNCIRTTVDDGLPPQPFIYTPAEKCWAYTSPSRIWAARVLGNCSGERL